MRINYNSPVILTFTIATFVIHLISAFILPEFTSTFFVIGSSFSFSDPWDYFRLVSHVMAAILNLE